MIIIGEEPLRYINKRKCQLRFSDCWRWKGRGIVNLPYINSYRSSVKKQLCNRPQQFLVQKFWELLIQQIRRLDLIEGPYSYWPSSLASDYQLCIYSSRKLLMIK